MIEPYFQGRPLQACFPVGGVTSGAGDKWGTGESSPPHRTPRNNLTAGVSVVAGRQFRKKSMAFYFLFLFLFARRFFYNRQIRKFYSANYSLRSPAIKNCIYCRPYTRVKRIADVQFSKEFLFLLFAYFAKFRCNIDDFKSISRVMNLQSLR